MVESSECDVKGVEGIFSENILACNVAEVEECIKSLDDVRMYIAFECVDEDLAGLSTSSQRG